MGINTIFKSVVKVVTDNSPAILTAMGVAGVITTGALTGRATIKAVRALDQVKLDVAEAEDISVEEVKLHPSVIAETVWTFYIPVAIAGATSIACIVGAHSVHTKRNAALLSLYTLSDKAYNEYKDKTKEIFGEKETQKVSESIAQDQVAKNPPQSNEVLVLGNGSMLCYEPMTGRYFESDYEQIRKAVNDINRDLLSDMYVSLNDFYSRIGLPPTSMGEELGWTQDKPIEIEPTSVLSNDGRPCLSFTYVNNPVPGYYKFN